MAITENALRMLNDSITRRANRATNLKADIRTLESGVIASKKQLRSTPPSQTNPAARRAFKVNITNRENAMNDKKKELVKLRGDHKKANDRAAEGIKNAKGRVDLSLRISKGTSGQTVRFQEQVRSNKKRQSIIVRANNKIFGM